MSSKFREQLDLRRKRSTAIREAVAEVRAQGADRSRLVVRQDLDARLSALEVDPPVSPDVLDGLVDSIIAGEGTTERSIRFARDIAGDLRGAAQKLRSIGEPSDQDGFNISLGQEPIIIRIDRTLPAMQVNLEPGIQEWLGEVIAREGGSLPPSPRDIYVLLEAGHAGEQGPVSVASGSRRLGTLGASDGQSFQEYLVRGIESRKQVATQALVKMDSASNWEIRVFHPSRKQ